MFVNLTNHPVIFWNENQRKEAEKYGEIYEIPFPYVSPFATSEEIDSLTLNITDKIRELKPSCILCCGEFVLTFRLVNTFKELGLKVVSTCSNRISKETTNSDGTIKKESVFEFVGFREY